MSATVQASAAATGSTLVPNRAPDTTGVFRLPAEGEPDAGPWIDVPADGDQYYRHAFLDVSDAVVVGADGVGIASTALMSGTPVEVWVQGCHESNPVQCAVVALRILS